MSADQVQALIERNGLAVVLLIGALIWIRQFVTQSLANSRADHKQLWDEVRADRESILQIVRECTIATTKASEAIISNTRALDHLSEAVERIARVTNAK